jgi:hypothetical protein
VFHHFWSIFDQVWAIDKLFNGFGVVFGGASAAITIISVQLYSTPAHKGAFTYKAFIATSGRAFAGYCDSAIGYVDTFDVTSGVG